MWISESDESDFGSDNEAEPIDADEVFGMQHVFDAS